MKGKNPRYRVWFKQAKFDLKASMVSMSTEYYEWSTFQSVQAVEKALKAIIVYSGQKPPRVHKLQVLIGISNRLCPAFRKTHFEFRFLESFTFISRYPFLIPGEDTTPHEAISLVDAEKAFNQAKDIIDKVARILKEPYIAAERKVSYAEKFSSEEIENRARQVKEKLITEFDPEKIILFGRFARQKEVSKLSTMDIMIVAKTRLPFIYRIQKARQVTKGGYPIVEPIVYTPEEFEVLIAEVGEGFIENALEEGKVLYEAERKNKN